MNTSIATWFFILSFLLTTTAFSQGCSDAGFCSIGSFQPSGSSENMSYSNQLKLGVSTGKADFDIKVNTVYLEYHKNVNNSSSIDVKLNYISQNNDLASNSGLSDLFLIGNWKYNPSITVSTGLKLGLTDGNEDNNGNYLPMDFQSSLGTLDFILGIAYKINGWQLFVAAQQPLNKNKNKFLAEAYPANSAFRKYQSTNSYKRKGDVLLRVAYPLYLNDKIILTPTILPVYHLGDDEFTNSVGDTEIIKGSNGLTLNANLFIDFLLSEKNKITISFASPLVVRDVRPDGLTRKFVVGLEYALKF